MTLPDFDPAFPIPVIAALAGTAAVFTLYRAFRGRPMQPAWVQGPVVLLRLMVIALLAFILMNPVERITLQAPESSSMILLDKSASMKLATGEKTTRWSDAKAWATQARQTIETVGQPVPPLAVFNQELLNVTDLDAVTPQGDETRLSAALASLFERGDEAPRQILVVSDGCTHDRGELPKVLATARDLGAKISTKVIGTDTPPRNAWIAAVQAPRSVRPKAKVAVHVDLASSGLPPDEPLALVLREDGGKEVARTDFRPRTDGGPVETVLTFEIGLRTTKYSLELVPAMEEVAADDNHFGFTVEVSSNKLRVLFVEGTHVKRTVGVTGHWWNDMELMTRAWDATGEIEYDCLTPISEYNDSPNLVGVSFQNGEMRQDPSRSFPATREELYRYDVMLISDVPVGNFSTEQMQWVVDWVNERGGGFLMGGGYTSFDVGNYDQTPWERITPVDMLAYGAGFMEKPFPIRIPESVKSHPLWKVTDDLAENEKALAAHPIFTGMNRVKRAKPGAIVLAVRADAEGDEPVMAAQSYGRGRSIAWLSDPNGGWAREYVTWGPPGGPPQGPHTELGHGGNFIFKEAAAKIPAEPTPPHPAPWYGDYWVNLVKWLGENSIRWHRDKLAGRAKAAAAKPGDLLPVAAEVLAVTKLDDLLALDVGARLDIPGTPRVRLEYDRDAREFVGMVPVPAGAVGEQVTVFFDATANGVAFTDAVPVGLRRSHLEFTETKPDSDFMKELADAGAGRVLDTPQDAATWLAEVAAERQKHAAVAWNKPLWPKWPLLAAILALLCLEWALRRRSMIPVVTTLAFLLTTDLSRGQDEKEIATLIEQLGAPKVRLRDEAEEKLKRIPQALSALKTASESATSPEARLRAKGLLGVIAQARWIQDATLSGHTTTGSNRQLCAMVVDGKGGKLYTRSQDFVRQWDLATQEPKLELGDPLSTGTNWTNNAPMTSLAISPDGKLLASTDNSGGLILNDTASGERAGDATTATMVLRTATDAEGNTHEVQTYTATPLVHIAFTPDNTILTSGLDFSVKLWSYPELKEQPGTFKLPHIGHAFAFSPDGKHLVISLDKSGEPDFIHVRNRETGANSCEISVPDRPNTLRLNQHGSLLLASNRNGSASLWSLKDGVLSDERVIARTAKPSNCAIFSPDEKAVFVASSDPDCCVSEYDLETGEALWIHPRSGFGVHTIAFLPDGRLAGTCSDMKLRIWSRGE
ncbi:glutamine amidotransferase [Luteolibacter arcticus]|uniref:Glutamine amidotransferase n=1 Tax=Luteolibacter arcticus TaxID=1581411 RepID=A0ABT3GBW2_9BACT|nr:glutamine amidotransferase [Luteolibacter arcticus]MCW1921115.1 glutamine amidotransferase [Luteolibacter arcticus]